MENALVGIVMGSDSDLEVMVQAAKVLDEFGVPWEMKISSAHRLPEDTARYAREAAARGLEVLIAGAGLAAHLPGVLASSTTLPVIGVPIKGGPLKGVDALYSIVQMPPGIPVATVAINGAKNAGILAVQILSLKYPELKDKLAAYKEKMAAEVRAKDARLQEIGPWEYLRD